MDSMTFSTSSSTSSDDYSSVEVCEKHQLVLSVICNDHEVVVCNRCCWVEHRDCQVILIEDAADTHRDEIKQHKKKLKKKSELIRRICEDRTSSSRGLRSLRELADVRQKFEEFCQRVSERLDEMKDWHYPKHGDRWKDSLEIYSVWCSGREDGLLSARQWRQFLASGPGLTTNKKEVDDLELTITRLLRQEEHLLSVNFGTWFLRLLHQPQSIGSVSIGPNRNDEITAGLNVNQFTKG